MEYLQSAYDYASSYACPPPPPESSPPTYLSPLQPHIKNFNTLVGDTPLAREKNKVPVVLGFFLFFTSIYILENFLQPGVSSSSKSSRHAWCVKVPSQIHASLVTVFGWACFLDAEMWDDPINAKSPSAIVGCRIICGYMIADLISVLVHFADEGVPFLLHAIFTFLPYYTALSTNTLVTFCASALIAETSTVPLNLRLLAILSNRTKNVMYEINQGLFFLVFIFVRIFICFLFLTPLYFTLFYTHLTGGTNLLSDASLSNLGSTAVPVYFWLLMVSVFLVMNCLNTFWAFNMVKIALGVGGGGGKNKDGKEEKKPKKESDGPRRRVVTLSNALVFGPVVALFPEDQENGKKD